MLLKAYYGKGYVGGGSRASHPVSSCLTSFKAISLRINVGPGAKVGRGKPNRGEKGVNPMFQVKVEFGASVFVSDWVFGADIRHPAKPKG